MNAIDLNSYSTFETIANYEDLQRWFCAYGWGCKSCGKLYSPEWFQCSGDTYCQRCKADMDAELNGLDWYQFPHTADLKGTQDFPYTDDSFGFEYAAQMRVEHERIYGY